MVRVLRPLPAASLKLLVFDLDGTLIDSARDLCNSVNATLAAFGREPLPDPVVASYIGDGAAMLVLVGGGGSSSTPLLEIPFPAS